MGPWFINALFVGINLSISIVYNDVQLKWVFTFLPEVPRKPS